MAELIPSLSSIAENATPGEQRLAQRLRDKLSDEYLCWFNAPVGERRSYPDFIVLHPRRGMLVLEVKDWRQETIVALTPDIVTLRCPDGTTAQAKNPLAQARDYVIDLVDQLRKDQALRQTGGDHNGKLAFPWDYGVVLSNITRRQFKKLKLERSLPAKKVICKDEMLERTRSGAFERRLRDMFIHSFHCHLNDDQINRIRASIYPELRISHQFDLFKERDEDAPDVMKVMSIQQEQFARGLGGGHRVIHGVAGSGKTLILYYRCDFLAKVLSKPVLVVCFNRLFASRLRNHITTKGWSEDKVVVRNYHRWCQEQLRAARIKPEHYSKTPGIVLQALQSGDIPKGQYGAIIVDEGNDFHDPDWLRTLTNVASSDEDPFLLLYDDAQSIYGNGLAYSLSEAGVKARGRTSILKVNYRNTDPIQHFAFKFAKQHLTVSEDEENQHGALEPIASGRQGRHPHLETLKDRAAECAWIADQIMTYHERGKRRWSDICVTYRDKEQKAPLAAAFKRARIPFRLYQSPEEKDQFDDRENVVKVLTMHSCKGLEFPVVIISGACDLPREDEDMANEARLLYIAMTRARETLVITGHREKGFVLDLKNAVYEAC